MKLKDINPLPVLPPEFLATSAKIEKWLNLHKIDNYTINNDLTVDAKTVRLTRMNFIHLPVKFRYIMGDFSMTHCNHLTTLKGCPDMVTGDFDCYQNRSLTSMDFAPNVVGGDVTATECNIINLHNIHKTIKQITGQFYCRGNPIKSHILGLCFIKGLKKVHIDAHSIDRIMNEHLHDINLCQEALIEAGYSELAKI